MVRVVVAALLAAGVTFGLFWLMHRLVLVGAEGRIDERESTVVEFVRVEKESETRTKERRLPEKVQPEQPPPTPQIQQARAPRPELGNVAIGDIDVGDMGEAPGAGAALSDMDAVPLVRVAPEYPMRAARRGIGGWVLLEFTVTTAGTTRDVKIVDAEPSHIFDRAAKRAVERFKYRPKVVDGKPVPQEGVQILLRFRPEGGS